MNNIKYLFLFLTLLFSCKKKETFCTEAYENVDPRLALYFKPEGVKLKYKSDKGDTATLAFGPITITQGYRTEQKPCKTTYYPIYTQKLVSTDTSGILPFKQVTDNGVSIFNFRTGNVSYASSDRDINKKITFSVNGKKYENVTLWTASEVLYGTFTFDSIAYTPANFILRIKDLRTNKVWTILN